MTTGHTVLIQAGEVITMAHPDIAGLLFVESPRNPTDAAVEVRVALKDGRAFALTFFTPAALVRLMRDNGQRSLVDVGMVVVREVSFEAVNEALDKLLLLGIERIGVTI